MFSLDGTPYGVAETGGGAFQRLNDLEDRMQLLRRSGELTDETLRAYFGDKRFEQIAESNAIEGSTLGVGETQLAVLRGITISGHDPAFAVDARNLSAALDRVVELAREASPTNIEQVKELHSLILGGHGGAGPPCDSVERKSSPPADKGDVDECGNEIGFLHRRTSPSRFYRVVEPGFHRSVERRACTPSVLRAQSSKMAASASFCDRSGAGGHVELREDAGEV